MDADGTKDRWGTLEGDASSPRARSRKHFVAFGALVLLGYLAWTWWSSTGTNPVFLVNGLDVSVVTHVDGRAHEISSGQRLQQVLSVGSHHVVTRTRDGALVEEIDVEVPRGTDLVAYNVLGAAPLEVIPVVYAADADAAGPPPEGTTYLGASWVTEDDVDVLFDPAPESVRMVGKRRVLRRAAVAEGGWRTSVQAMGAKRMSEALALASRIAEVQGDDASIGFAGAVAHAAGPDAARRFGDMAVARWPKSIEAHRAYQGGDRNTEREAALRSRYRAMHEEDPDAAAAGYLYARLLPNAQALPLLERLLAKSPDDAWIRRSLGIVLVSEARFAEAVPHLEKVPLVEERWAAGTLPILVQALAGSGAVSRAQALIVEEVKRRKSFEGLLLHLACLARLPGADPAAPTPIALSEVALAPDAERAAVEPIFHAHARDAVRFEATQAGIEDPGAREALRLAVLSASDPEAAARDAVALTPEEAARLDDLARVTLACECLRLGDESTSRRLFEGPGEAPIQGLPYDALRDPARASEREDVDVELRAALAFAGSRRAADAAERDRLLAYARRYDVFRRVVP